MKITIRKPGKKAKAKPEPTIPVTIPNHIELRGGETGTLLSDKCNIVVKFKGGMTVDSPPELFETERRCTLKQNELFE